MTSDLFVAFNIILVVHSLHLIVHKLRLILKDSDKSLRYFTYFAIMNLGISYYLIYKVVEGIVR
mgnify:CR=1 FL=1